MPSLENLLSCIANRAELNLPADTSARDRAATRIQSIWRMYRCRIYYTRDRHLFVAARCIQRAWRRHARHRATRQTIVATWHHRLTAWRARGAQRPKGSAALRH